MKRLICSIALLACLAGCESRTDYGPCVGIADKQNPKLHYKLSVTNVAVGVIFFEMVVPPIQVLANETFCPVGPAE